MFLFDKNVKVTNKQRKCRQTLPSVGRRPPKHPRTTRVLVWARGKTGLWRDVLARVCVGVLQCHFRGDELPCKEAAPLHAPEFPVTTQGAQRCAWTPVRPGIRDVVRTLPRSTTPRSRALKDVLAGVLCFSETPLR